MVTEINESKTKKNIFHMIVNAQLIAENVVRIKREIRN